MEKNLITATFAGGCFWCMEPPYDELEGVISTISGYTGGTKTNPTYEQVSAGTTGRSSSQQRTSVNPIRSRSAAVAASSAKFQGPLQSWT